MTSATSDAFTKIMEEATKTFAERNSVYQDGWVRHGKIMEAFFPDGLQLKTPEDFSRFLLFEMCVSKLNRYAANFKKGGHQDSIHDCGVYSFILETYDQQLKEEKEENEPINWDS